MAKSFVKKIEIGAEAVNFQHFLTRVWSKDLEVNPLRFTEDESEASDPVMEIFREEWECLSEAEKTAISNELLGAALRSLRAPT